MRISDWSSDVCSSDLGGARGEPVDGGGDRSARGGAGRGSGARRRRRRIVPPQEDAEEGAEEGAAAGRAAEAGGRGRSRSEQIGRASCRERVCQYVSISVVDLSLKKKNTDTHRK